MNPRETALNALMACRKDGGWPNAVLKDYIRRDRLDSRDAGLATRLCYGVLQNRNKLDFYLDQLLTGKPKDLHPVLRDILHLGLYQLYELDKIPDSAAVNESVSLAKKYCKNPRAASLANGVLRNAARSRDQIRQPVSYADRYSHPDELITLLKANLPKGKLEPMLIADNTAPQTVAQVNTLRISGETLAKQLERGDFVPAGFEVSFSAIDNLKAMKIRLSEDERLWLQGRIDRLDQCEDGPNVYIKIIDYKSGSAGFDLAAVYYGLQLQLVVYLDAVMELKEREFPGRNVVPAGIFYYNIKDPVADREEVRDAMENGSGKAWRQSDTLDEQNIYYALRLSNGNVLRISSAQRSVVSLVLGVLQPLLWVALLLIILAAVFASRASKKIVISNIYEKE